jgi:hypothetical protein
MSDYIVTWEINIEDVDSPQEAAREAMAIQQDRTSDATTFTVQEYGRTYPHGLDGAVYGPIGDSVEVNL